MVISTRIVDVDDLIFGRDERVIPSERRQKRVETGRTVFLRNS